LSDLTVQHVVLRIVAVLLIASVHGFVLAALAGAMGDPGPRHDERLSLSPWRHADPAGGLLMVLFALGWIRPVTVDPRQGRLSLLAIVLGASCATLALGVLPRFIRPFVLNLLPDTAAATFFVFIETLGQLCVSFTLLNLLPIPILTGQHLLVALLPNRSDTIRRLQPYAAVLLGLLIVTGVMGRLLAPAEAAVASVIFGG
jgi:Zn-dependent protease